jgi:hypothetical protein
MKFVHNYSLGRKQGVTFKALTILEGWSMNDTGCRMYICRVNVSLLIDYNALLSGIIID